MAFGFSSMPSIGQRLMSLGGSTNASDALAEQARQEAIGKPGPAAPPPAGAPLPSGSGGMVQTPHLPTPQPWNPNGVNLPTPSAMPQMPNWNPNGVNLPDLSSSPSNGGSVLSSLFSSGNGSDFASILSSIFG